MTYLWTEHAYDSDEDRCICGGVVVYFEDGDRNGLRGDGCEVANSVWPPKEVAILVTSGGIWHAGVLFHPGTDREIGHTFCGRWGEADHLADDSPMRATLEPGFRVQVVECLQCDRKLEKRIEGRSRR